MHQGVAAVCSCFAVLTQFVAVQHDVNSDWERNQIKPALHNMNSCMRLSDEVIFLVPS